MWNRIRLLTFTVRTRLNEKLNAKTTKNIKLNCFLSRVH